jgi:hypothetical protein
MLGIFSKWLVGGFKQFFIFRNIWDNPSHWLIFFQMVKTTNQMDKSWFWCLFHSGLTHTHGFLWVHQPWFPGKSKHWVCSIPI